MNPVLTSMATIAISSIYVVWHSYIQFQARREHVLRDRVAYMLWVMATREE